MSWRRSKTNALHMRDIKRRRDALRRDVDARIEQLTESFAREAMTR